MLRSRCVIPALFSVVLVLAVACKGSGEASGPFRSLEFNVDSTRLGLSVAVGAIALRAPAGWQTPDSTILAVLKSRLAQDSLTAGTELKAVLLSMETGGVMIGTQFPIKPAAGFAAWARTFTENYRATQTGRIEEDWLKVAGIPCVQLYQADSLRVLFKFLVDADPPVALDYSIPRANWEKEARAVESSLGTLRRK